MKSFFANMNFVRAVMLVCLLAAAGLGYMGYDAQSKVETLRNQVRSAAPNLGKEIQQLAVELDALQKIESGSEFESIKDPKQYIRKLAVMDTVRIGDVDPDPKPEKSYVTGTVDKIWGIEPPDRKRPFSRAKISNYMYILEAESPFVVVTKAELQAIDKINADEFPTDRWTFKVEITSRTPDTE
ncbi:MAG: hypothetical protein P1V81_12090 [Planctomycetota bacterium]|nr:hypothetical protein [Planctomycetota bacterium]